MTKSQNQEILSTFYSHKILLLALLGLFTDRNDKFANPFMAFNKWDSYPFIYLKPEKGTPFGGSLSEWGHYREWCGWIEKEVSFLTPDKNRSLQVHFFHVTFKLFISEKKKLIYGATFTTGRENRKVKQLNRVQKPGRKNFWWDDFVNQAPFVHLPKIW